MSNAATDTTSGTAKTTAHSARADRLPPAFAISAGVTSVVSALLVVIKETNEHTVLAWMKAATGHHWVTHGIIDLILFVLIGFLAARYVGNLEDRPGLAVATLIGGVATGGLIIVGFFGS
mgnify:CR=1 FL=1